MRKGEVFDLPPFLYENDGLILIGYRGDSDVTEEWGKLKNKIMEYAKQEAIGFAEWVLKEGWAISSVGSWKNFTKEIPMDFDTKHLYKLYLKSKKNKTQ